MDEPAASFAFTDPSEEADFQGARQLLLQPPRFQQKTQLLLISLALFVVFAQLQGGASMLEIGLLVGVVLVHELGHAIGMIAFGYRDVRVFFIPLLGAAAQGRKRGVARWKEGFVLLLGPLPGIVVGTVLAFVDGPRWLDVLTLQFLIINALNLVPIAPFDGGQLFQLVVFSRHRVMELVFVGVTAALLSIGALLAGMWILAGVGVFLLIGLSHRKRILEAAHQLRDRGWSADPAQLHES
ncbi:MAG: hypothetical protein AB7O24_13620 [Kofleriaceae bacterium]